MATEVQTQTGQCPTHGTVDATRDMPAMGVPYIYFAVTRALARRKQFTCPECGAPVTA
jgi:hypothetical protein